MQLMKINIKTTFTFDILLISKYYQNIVNSMRYNVSINLKKYIYLLILRLFVFYLRRMSGLNRRTY